MAKVTIDTTVSGPFFGKSAKEMATANREWIGEMVKEGEAKTEAQLFPGHGYDTGEYKSTIHGTIKADLHGGIGNDGSKRSAIIGAMLENSSAQNPRMKGYHIWRKTRQHITKLTKQLAGHVYKKAVQRLT